ncbi:MAG: exonuclease domain-containing protein [Dechloromonas sp.]|nr:exonuclease domain-containing protein [Dechloromonas sp.]
MQLAFVDLETTGATAGADRITEIGIVEVDADGSVREWQQLVNPGVTISPFIAQLTGISNAMVAQAPPFAAVAAEVRARLAGRIFLAHNARFDYGFLKAEFARVAEHAAPPFRATTICTVKLSRELYPEHKRHSLDALIERHQLRAAARHRALADAQLIHQFWQKIQVDRSAEAIAAALDQQHATPCLPPEIDARVLDQLPEAAGVYLFYGEHLGQVDQPLYVGRCRDIRQHVLSHFVAQPGSERKARLARAVRRIEWQEITDNSQAQWQENTLLRQLRPAYNRPPRSN